MKKGDIVKLSLDKEISEDSEDIEHFGEIIAIDSLNAFIIWQDAEYADLQEKRQKSGFYSILKLKELFRLKNE